MEKIRALVNDELKKIQYNINYLIESDNQILRDVKLFLLSGSKYIRSILALLYLKAYDKEINSNIITLLSSAELFHNASLLHDDVIDGSVIRRGKQTLYDKYGAHLAVILGDFVLSNSVRELMRLNDSSILNIFLETTKSMSTAEILQYNNRNKIVTIDEYLNIIRGKTASLFSAILQSSAQLCDLDALNASKIGEVFGMIFQINNDQNLQSLENDKKNGVKTSIDIIGIEKTFALKDNYKEELRKYLKKIPDNKYRNGIEDLIDLL